MSTVVKRLCLQLMLIAIANCAIADTCHVEKHASLPITFNGFLPTVPVTINGHVLNIGIDTGSAITVISPEVVKNLNLPFTSDNQGHIRGTDGNRIVPTVMMDLLVLGIDKYLRNETSVVALHTPSLGLSNDVHIPMPPTGIIGTDVLSGYEIEYDPAARMLNLYRARHCDRVVPPWQGDSLRIPVTLSQGKCFLVPASLDGRMVRALFDSGLDRTSVARAFAKQIGLTDNILAHDPQIYVRGAAGILKSVPDHTFDSLVIGDDTFHRPRFHITNVPVAEADAALGEDYMRSHRFWLSYATHVLYIQRTSDR